MNRSNAFDAIRCLKSAWNLTTRAPGALWGAGLILVLVEGCSSEYSTEGRDDIFHVHSEDGALELSGWMSGWISDLASEPFAMAAVLGLALVLMIAFGALTAWLQAGYYNGVNSVMQGRTVGFGSMYGYTHRWLPTFLAEIFRVVLYFACVAFGLVFIALPVIAMGPGGGPVGVALGVFVFLPTCIYFALGTTFMKYAAAIDGLGPVQAFSRSWSLVDGQRMSIIAMHIVQFGVAILGILAFCVGIFPAAVLSQIMWVEAYVQATDDGSLSPRRSRPRAGAPEERHAEVRQPAEIDPSSPPAEPGSFDPGAWREDLDVPPGD